MAKVKIVYDEQAIAEFVGKNKPIRDLLVHTAQDVAAEAQSTASDAENGSGGTIDGYAAAGFKVVYESRGGKRPRVLVVSNADSATATAAHFHSQRKNGVAHLRAALYKFTQRG